MLWPQQGFLPGLVAFLLAHLAYLWAFTRGVRLAAWAPAFISYALLAAAVLSLLWAGVPAALRALWILASYWAAQWLIASSLPPRRIQA